MAKRRYTGYDKTAKRKRAGLEKLVDLLEAEFGLWNNGTYGVRKKRGKSTYSVHSTGRAADKSWRGAPYKGSGKYEDAVRMMDFLVENADELEIEAVFDYYPKPFGRGWMCDRGAWKVYDRRAFSGAPGGDWVHIEISNKYADDPDYYEQKMAELLGGKKPARKPTAKKAAPAYPGKSLRKGSKGDDVKLVQEKVGATPDGDFGPKTEKSVKSWQADNTACCGPSDGIVGPKTWGCMFG
jgi:hypothetical protein